MPRRSDTFDDIVRCCGSSSIKLALVIGSLTGGGAERVIATLANAWARRGDTVTLVTISGVEQGEYPLEPAVERIALGLAHKSANWWRGLINNRRRVRTLRAVLRAANPDGVLSFMTSTNVLSVFAARVLGIPVLVAERISPGHHRHSIVWRNLRLFAYRGAAAIVVQTERGAVWLRERISNVPVRVIPNPMQIDNDEALDVTAQTVTDACRERNVLLAVGRLDAQKGYDMLLSAFASTAHSHPSWHLVILGEGAERDRIEIMAKDLELADRVLLPGFSKTPHALMRRAELFAMSSRYEGFPNALLEAMACGLPCVSFDCPTGPREIIRDGESGLLVPPEDIAALAGGLSRLMDDERLREKLGHAARIRARDYSLDSILARWDSLFKECGVSAVEDAVQT